MIPEKTMKHIEAAKTAKERLILLLLLGFDDDDKRMIDIYNDLAEKMNERQGGAA